MPDTVRIITDLFLKYWTKELQEHELNYLIDWVNQSESNSQTFKRLTNADYIVERLRELSMVKQEIKTRIWDSLEPQASAD